MAHRPTQPVIIVVNSDGSGYVKQFDTVAQAKEAYKTITTDGVAYLYPKAKKSISSKPAGSPAPISSTGQTQTSGGSETKGGSFTSENNAGKNNNGGISNITAGNIEIVSTVAMCISDTIYDMDGNPFTGQYRKVNRVTYNNGHTQDNNLGDGVSPCHYPVGFRIDYESPSFLIEKRIIQSIDYTSGMFGPFYNPEYLLRVRKKYTIADGSGGTQFLTERGVVEFVEQGNNIPRKIWHYYVNGDAPYKFNNDLFITDKVGYPIPNGRYAVQYKVEGDEAIYSGYWKIEVAVDGTYFSALYKFEPANPAQPVPPSNSILKEVGNGFGGLNTVIDTNVIYPTSVQEDCQPPLTVDIEGQSVIIATNIKKGMNNGYGYTYWAECSGMTYLSYGTKILDTESYEYFSDGVGSYYSTAKAGSCPPSGSLLNRNTTDVNVNINGTYWLVGHHYEDTIANGNCGSGVELSSEYIASGTFITDDSNNNYYSDGAGSYYNSSKHPSYGTYLYTDGNYSYYADGNGGSYGTYNPPSCTSYGTLIDSGSYNNSFVWYAPDGSSGTYTYGGYSYSYYADGNCGSYSQGNGWSQPSGTNITSGSYNYPTGTDEYGNTTYGMSSYTIYFDGNSGYYIQY